MGYTISKDFDFEASHVLHGLPDGHKCGRTHGHSYLVRVILSGDVLDETGFILDFGDLAPVKKFIDSELDHRHLNDVMNVQPSAELIAAWIYRRVLVLVPEIRQRGITLSVSVSETRKSWATYTE